MFVRDGAIVWNTVLMSQANSSTHYVPVQLSHHLSVGALVQGSLLLLADSYAVYSHAHAPRLE